MKKGAWEIENVGKLLLALFILFILIATVIILRSKGINIVDKIREVILFR